MVSGLKEKIFISKVGSCAKCSKRLTTKSVLCKKCSKWYKEDERKQRKYLELWQKFLFMKDALRELNE